MEVKRLEKVNIRDIWKNEAINFTRWLEENIDFLNEVLPFNINNVEREKGVGAFSVDLTGEDENGDLVIIENQLEKTNHDHLGKIVTYLSNLGAKTAIWICKEPRKEHEVAIDWLNKFTQFNFYLIKVEAVKIGNSPIAPLFSIISEPTEEAREAGQKSKEMAQRHIKRMQFWEKLLNKIKEKKIKLHSNISPSKYSWIGTGAGKSGLGFNYTVTYDSASVELYIDRGKDSKEINKQIFDQLYKNKEKIENLFGGKLNWERLDNRRACRISKRYDLGLRNEEEWDKLQDKMIEDMQKLEFALKEFIKRLKI